MLAKYKNEFPITLRLAVPALRVPEKVGNMNVFVGRIDSEAMRSMVQYAVEMVFQVVGWPPQA